jgi:dTDP-4-dehydrorhamnose 3,5-epimerase
MGTELQLTETSIAGVFEIRSLRRQDARGSFARWFCQRELEQVLQGASIRQINHSLNTNAGVVRGLHFQYPPAAEYKLVRCIRGVVMDFVVDLRAGSTSFLQHLSIRLSESEDLMLMIPPGCAHGFQALQDNSQLLYLHTSDYQPGFEGGYPITDPRLKIQLPLPISTLSERDANFAALAPDFIGIHL